MNVAVYNCSPKGQDCSITARTIQFLDKMFPEDKFQFFDTSKPSLPQDAEAAGKNSDLIIITSSIFGGSIHPQAMAMFQDMLKTIPKTVKITYFITCNWLGEDFARRQVRQFFESHGYEFIESYAVGDGAVFADENISGKMYWEGSLESIYNWFATVKAIASDSHAVAEKSCNAVIMNTFETESDVSKDLIDRISLDLTSRNINHKIIRLNDYTVKPCTACQLCYSDGVCIHNDDMNKLLDDVGFDMDMVIVAGELKDSSLGLKFENYMSRFACFGRCSTDTELLRTYFYVTDNIDSVETYIFDTQRFAFDSYNHDIHIKGGCVGRSDTNIVNESIISRTINTMTCCFNNNFIPSASMYERYFNKNFADLHIRLQNMCPTEYQAFKTRGYYEPIALETHVKYIDKTEVKKAGINPNKPRTIPFQMMYSGFDKSQIKFTERRANRNKHVYDKQFVNVAENKSEPKKFGLFGKKK